MLVLPIAALVWGGILLVRLIARGLRAPSPAGVKSPLKEGILRTPLTISHFLYIGSVLIPVGVSVGVGVQELLGTGVSSLLASVLAVYLTFRLPHWLAWRVLGPRGWVRTAGVMLRLAFHLSRDDRKGAVQLLEAAYSQGWQPGPGKVTFWTVFALALKAEEEDPRRADLILAGIHRFGRLPRPRLKTQGMELVAWPALRRHDWRRVQQRVEEGRGRGVRLLGLIARAHLDAPAWPPFLWLAWALAPDRRATLPYVREALTARRGRAPASRPPEETGGVWLSHLRLLARAAAGRTVRAAELEALARDWEEALGGAGHTRILARGLELGVQDMARAASTLRESLESELETLAAVAEGAWSQGAGTGLAGLLRSRQIEGLIQILEREMAGLPASGGVARALDPPLVELERWYRFQRDVERLRAAGGRDAVQTAWFNGLRYVACNWPVYLGRAYNTDSAWACREMHLWCASLSAEVMDEDIHRLSADNATRY
jgi:hypothetical protein